MTRYIIVSIASGVLFGVLDALVHANPLARRLYEVYRPIARTSVNAPAGVAIDLAYGFILAALFLLLHQSLPGASGLAKGLCFGLLVWFLRVAMATASSLMLFGVPGATLLYGLVAGLVQMLILGAMYGLTLRAGT